MTNPISKAIVKAAVAMGYGKKSDYKGSSVADVLEKFAAIAKDKGGSGGGGSFVIGGTVNDATVTLDKTAGEIFAAMKKQNVVVVLEQPMEGVKEMVITFFMADAAPVNDAIYYTFRVAGGMQTVAATADAYPKMSLA